MTSRETIYFLTGFAAGWVGLLIAKYYIFGLPLWDAELHPERLPCDLN